MGKRILFTGGAGKAGRHVVPYLVDAGYEVHNLDLVPLDHPGVSNLIVDITDAGQVYSALSMHRDLDDLDTGGRPYDAVVHFAAIPRILIKPDNETFRINTMGTYNIVEAAVKLGIRKIIVASSETTYGVCFAEGHRDFHHFPLEEDYDVNPMDSYGLSKVLNEKTARAFAERSGFDIYALRIGNVIEPHEYANFPTYFAHPEMRKRIAWSYIDARDLGQICKLCIEKDGLGFEIFNACNNTVSANTPTRELAERFFPNVPFRREIDTYEGLLSNRKIREVLGFTEEHDWRRYVKV
ncbi:NAD(P)-dependent oxidoreductase [Rhizobium sp. CC-YZS058]|uniref:NAD-dependent epimerase/dehydratase family protein n=1 Tax=Rhizobium sp. CC-YZS058 TaxID=3042153 RepID=UPI002B058137|nr:NAD(P)-dependent oxidoreductase [Rhizobium sp. CC-YZS058]MEA3535163.1 NAD(P)-dependent oxidoreductase [Rhizobium sp. CC-YZS058]